MKKTPVVRLVLLGRPGRRRGRRRLALPRPTWARFRLGPRPRRLGAGRAGRGVRAVRALRLSARPPAHHRRRRLLRYRRARGHRHFRSAAPSPRRALSSWAAPSPAAGSRRRWPNGLFSRRSTRPWPRAVSRSFCSPDCRHCCRTSSSTMPTVSRAYDFVTSCWRRGSACCPARCSTSTSARRLGGAAALAGGKAPDTGLAGRVFWWVGLAATVARHLSGDAAGAAGAAQGLAIGEPRDSRPRRRRTHMPERRVVSPPDDWNRMLRDAVHPSDWINPDPPPRYNLLVVGGGHRRAGRGRRRGRTRRPRRPGRARPARRRLPHHRLRAVQGAAARCPRRRRGADRRAVRRADGRRGRRFPGGHGANAAAANAS